MGKRYRTCSVEKGLCDSNVCNLSVCSKLVRATQHLDLSNSNDGSVLITHKPGATRRYHIQIYHQACVQTNLDLRTALCRNKTIDRLVSRETAYRLFTTEFENCSR